MQNLDHSPHTFHSHPSLALEDYFQLGWHIEPNLISDETVERLIRHARALKHARRGDFSPCMMPHRQDEIYLQALSDPAIVNIIAQLISGDAVGLQTQLFYCPRGTQGFSLHQDNFFVQAPPNAFASAWIPLVDTYPENGGLKIFSGTHKLGDLPVIKTNVTKDKNQDPNANNEETLVPPGYEPVSVTVPKGSVLFIHGHLVHGSHDNSATDWRYVLLTTYIRRGERFRPGHHARRTEIELCQIT